jgi:TorA maturation chaperone TorD
MRSAGLAVATFCSVRADQQFLVLGTCTRAVFHATNGVCAGVVVCDAWCAPYTLSQKRNKGGRTSVTALLRDVAGPDIDVSAEDQLRAGVYRLLARTLSRPPSSDQLRELAALSGGAGSFGSTIKTLASVAAASSASTVAAEFQTLFIGLGRGELVPYGSYYLTGFLQEKPLAKLRQDMVRLGIRRDARVSDPEDHIASELEMMAGLIDGAFGAPLPVDQQKTFFDSHIGSWTPVFFRDLERADASVLYSALGSVGRAFLDIEDAAFAMV